MTLLYQDRLGALTRDRDHWRSESEYWEGQTKPKNVATPIGVLDNGFNGDAETCFNGNTWGCFPSSAESLAKNGDAERLELSINNLNAVIDLRARHLTPELADQCHRETLPAIETIKSHFNPQEIEALRSRAPAC